MADTSPETTTSSPQQDTTTTVANTINDTAASLLNSKSSTVYDIFPTSPNQMSPLTDAQNTMDAIKNSEAVQSLANGPVASKARAEANTTKTELSNLASARTTPSATTATGQPLTHYHSFFFNLLSWENPRATAISYVVVASFIVATRYVPLVKYSLRGVYIILGIMAAAEATGKLFMEQGFASKLRPNKYYTIPRETLESMIEDLVELLNFFVIEFQRIVFAENVLVTTAAFITVLSTYFLINVTPFWGLALLFTTAVYFIPLIYVNNKELIDSQLNSASEVVAAQTQQVRDLASQQTNKAVEMSQSALRDYGARANEMVGNAKKAAVEKGVVSADTAEKLPGGAESVKKDDFPAAPQTDPTPPSPAPVQDSPVPVAA